MVARNTAWFACAPELRLHIDELAVEQLLGAVDGKLLGDIDVNAAAIVAAPRIAFGVFVGQDAALGFHHRDRDDVLRGDQLDAILLALQLVADGGGEFRIRLGERRGEEPARIGSGGVGVHVSALRLKSGMEVSPGPCRSSILPAA